MRSLARSLVRHGKIKTTATRAKAIRPFIEKMVTRWKKSNIQAARLTRHSLSEGSASERKHVKDFFSRYALRDGGYTRITKLPRRSSDGSSMAVIEFIK